MAALGMVALAGVFMVAAAEGSQTAAIVRVSTTAAGGEANGSSTDVAASADGRYVVFASDATNLVAGDVNGASDVFLKDTRTGSITLVSSNFSGIQSNGISYNGAVSADGRYVAFCSTATNLVTPATNGQVQVFVKDMVTGVVSLASAGQNQQPGDGASIAPSISADGRYVAFESAADNLVPGDANASHDVFVTDLRSGLVRLASARSDGVQADRGGFAPAISADGGMVVFMSPATNLVAGASDGSLTQIYRKDLSGGGVTLVSASAAGQPGDKDSIDHAAYGPAISADGRYAAFVSSADNLVAGDTNGVVDVFLKDVQTGTVSRISTDSSG
ncbi:MAG: calcium-binding protein, partial [Thermoleophilia bacterium]